MKKNDKEVQMQFLLTDYELTINQRWKVYERGNEVYRFYITIISGFTGLFLTLITLGTTWNEINIFVSMGSFIVFLLGIIILIQLIGVEKYEGRLNKRLGIAQKKISEITLLEDYFSQLEAQQAEYLTRPKKYSLQSLFRRAKRRASSKTQLILINSVIGTVTILMITLRFMDRLQILIPLGAISLMMLVLIHLMIVSFFARN